MKGRLVIVGSGETAPTMVKMHREVLAHTGGGLSALVDTPFGFQVNADDLTDKIRAYFRESVGQALEVARWRRRDEPLTDRERALALIGQAAYVFAGPGSPSYALSQWAGTPMPAALRGVVERGGTLVMGSAAAVTIGRFAIPVYEIYKVGADPYWSEGLGILDALAGIGAAVVPHFDNREGGRHDTRFCYLGEERLVAMEAELPADIGVLGVDEHTAVVIDLGSETATVHGSGCLTLRHRTRSTVVPSGETISLAELRSALAGAAEAPLAETRTVAVTAPASSDSTPSLRAATDAIRADFDQSLAAGDAEGALSAALELEQTIHAWSADTLQGDDLDIARAALRSMIVALASAAVDGLRDPREAVAPYVEIALASRQRARDAKDFAASDLVRDQLAAAGVEVRDTPAGQEWSLLP